LIKEEHYRIWTKIIQYSIGTIEFVPP